MATTKKSSARSAPRKSAAKKAVPRAASPTAKSRVRKARLAIRMYRHGLGDCLLLRFARKDKGTFNVLIDCGIIMVAERAKDSVQKVVSDITSVCGGRIDLVVMTHEHWDHASGFSKQHAQKLFDQIDIGEVWYGWTEDPNNELGRRLRKERADKVQALGMAALALQRSPAMAVRAAQLGSILGFFGMDGSSPDLAAAKPIQKTRDAFEYLKNRRGVKTRYLYPDKAPITLPGVEDVRVFVMGPPQDESLIKKSTPSKSGREVYELASEASLAVSLDAAFRRFKAPQSPGSAFDDCPFDTSFRQHRLSTVTQTLIDETWNHQDQQYRQIEDDWTQAAETLALNLDSHTNNTCVVLAFEFADTGEVFLFPADAQVGNWLSWQDVRWRIKGPTGMTEVTGPELLARTVFYKVGHHGSHNATLSKLGLELMTSEDLLAFIPVIKDQAIKSRWMNMPFGPLVKGLKKKTGGRVLQSDMKPPTRAELAALPAAARTRFLNRLIVDPLYFEYSY